MNMVTGLLNMAIELWDIIIALLFVLVCVSGLIYGTIYYFPVPKNYAHMDRFYKFLETFGFPKGVTIAGFLIVYFMPLWPVVLVIFSLLGADFITGVIVSMRLKEEWSWDKFTKFLIKLWVYPVVLFATFGASDAVLSKYIENHIPIELLLAGAIIMWELRSLYLNAQILTGIDFWSVVKSHISLGNTELRNKQRSSTEEEEKT